MATRLMLDGESYDRMVQIYKNIPEDSKKKWMENHPIQSDPFGTRHPSPSDVESMVKAWVHEQNMISGLMGDPLMKTNISNRGLGDSIDHMGRTHRTDGHTLNSDIIHWFKRIYPAEEAFLRSHAETYKIHALDALKDMIRRCMDVGMKAEVKTATSGINQELKRLEEEKHELHRTGSKRDKRGNAYPREGESSIPISLIKEGKDPRDPF